MLLPLERVLAIFLFVSGAFVVLTFVLPSEFDKVFARLASADASAEVMPDLPDLPDLDPDFLRFPLDLLLVVLLIAFPLVL